MGRACSMHEGKEEYVYDFGRKSSRTKTTMKSKKEV
jgi:hypothetical protein